jgi:hypothetical protein
MSGHVHLYYVYQQKEQTMTKLHLIALAGCLALFVSGTAGAAMSGSVNENNPNRDGQQMTEKQITNRFQAAKKRAHAKFSQAKQRCEQKTEKAKAEEHCKEQARIVYDRAIADAKADRDEAHAKLKADRDARNAARSTR